MKIIYGRSGTGKTEYIYERIKQDKTSKKIYIITPEQFTYSAEKKLLEKMEDVSLNAEVLSFERMAHKVISETMNIEKDVITKSGKSMAIVDAVLKNQKNLHFLGKSLENVETILTQITEFKKHGVTKEDLANRIEKTQDEYLKAKLNDMYLMYEALDDKIADFIDENDNLNILYLQINQSKMFENCTIFIDNFAGFTRQEFLIIQKLNEIANEVYITLCIDNFKMNKIPETDIFYDNKQTLMTLVDMLDIDIDDLEKESICFSDNKRAKNEELIHLEQNLYGFPYHRFEKELSHIKLFLADNKYEEINYVGKEIYKLVRDENYRYKDIAVICKDVGNYSMLIKALFKQYEIPFFIDDKKDLNQNIFIKYVLSVLEIFDDNWSYESMFNYIKLGFIDICDVYKLENYCLKWGITGKKKFTEEWNYENEAEDGNSNFKDDQKKLIEPLLKLREKMSGRKTASEITDNLYAFIVENIKPKIEEMLKSGDNIQNDIECWNITIDLLTELKRIFKDQQMTFEEYSKILKVGLKEKELGQIPATLDEVIIGDVDRTKANTIKAMFIIGLNDGVFPSGNKDEGYLNDKDRESLKAEGIELAKTCKQKSYEENFNIYKAFTQCEEKLYLSYPKMDSDGGALRKSILITKMCRIFPLLHEEKNETLEILNKEITLQRLLETADYNQNETLLKWYYDNDKENLELSLDGIDYTNLSTRISKDIIDKMYENGIKTSVSKLETYMSCPFQYFMKYDLQIKEEEKLDIKPIDTGSFMHSVIDTFFKENTNYKYLSDGEIEKIVSQIIDDELFRFKKFSLNEKYKTLVRRLKRVVTLSLKYIIASLKFSQFEIYGTEVEFGKSTKKADSKYILKQLPAIELTLSNGKNLKVEGVIDRVDIASLPGGKYIRVIDYKSSAHDLDLNKVYGGIQLQLITYINAASLNKEIDAIPSAALYYTLFEPKIKERHKNVGKDEIEKIIKDNFKMQGVILADLDVIEAMDTNLKSQDGANKSSAIPVSLSKDGQIDFSKSKSCITKDEFESLQKFTNKMLKKISDEITSGNIDIRPYYNAKGKNTPCEFCSFKKVCSFDTKFEGNNYRYITNMQKQDILDKMKIEKEK